MKNSFKLIFLTLLLSPLSPIIAQNIPTASVFSYEDGALVKDGKKYRYIPYDKRGKCIGTYFTQPYKGPLRILSLVRLRNNYITAFEDGTIYRGSTLHGLRHTKLYYGQKVDAMVAYKGGILTAFEQGGILWSPDTNYPGGGGTGKRKAITLQRKGQRVRSMIVHKGGIIYAFEQGGVIWSPNGSYPGGKKGFTQTLYKGPQKVNAMQPYKTKNGFLIAFDQGGVFFSKDGKNINGGGDTEHLLTRKVYSFSLVHKGFATVFMDDLARVRYSPEGNYKNNVSNLYDLCLDPTPIPPLPPKRCEKDDATLYCLKWVRDEYGDYKGERVRYAIYTPSCKRILNCCFIVNLIDAKKNKILARQPVTLHNGSFYRILIGEVLGESQSISPCD